MQWQSVSVVGPKQFQCGHCGLKVGNDRGYFSNIPQHRIMICPHCDKPTFFDEAKRQFPDITPGNDVQHLPNELEQLYREARNCCSVSAFTASVLASRKMLMNIAVHQKAQEGLKFVEYVDYLANKGFVPPDGRCWVDHIRKRGNEATHEIALMTKSDAEELITFTEMLLKFIYEFPNRVPAAQPAKP